MANTEKVQLLTLSERRQNILTLRVMLSVISAVFSGMGVLAMLTQHYYGVTSKNGHHEINLDGDQAVAMGLTLFFLGAIPLGVWWNSKPKVLTWCIVCTIAFAVSLVMTLQLGRA